MTQYTNGIGSCHSFQSLSYIPAKPIVQPTLYVLLACKRADKNRGNR
ncbi:hypothetical protein [Vibrio gallaecicus]|nr:hypothetical protein [Vibrio gallaecicus]MDN3616108.1 hypothetical protein [Vibrio gallaecicus]